MLLKEIRSIGQTVYTCIILIASYKIENIHKT